jgi:Ferritin-like
MAQNSFRRLRWESVDEIARTNATRETERGWAGFGAPTIEKDHPLIKLLQRTNVPRHPNPSASAREEAEFLLQAASEVEHQFIVQYLYAVFSIDTVSGGELADQCATHFREIAEEEMGHLLTVQNALLLIGAPPYFERESNPPLEPQPFPLVLEPVSLAFVSRFLVAESPVDAKLPDDLGKLKKTIDHVGALYAMLYWLFQDNDTPQEPWLLPSGVFPSGQHLKSSDYNTDTAQIENLLNTASDWGASGGIHVLPQLPLDTTTNIADATRRALYDIALQGEGPVEIEPDLPKDISHFHRLLRLYEGIKSASSDLKLALDIPINPHTDPLNAGNPEAEAGLITDEIALLHANFFNLRYAMLLLEIALSVIVSRSKLVNGTPVKRTLAIRAISAGMQRGVGALGRKLVTMPLKLGQGGIAPPFAGPPFALPQDLFPVDERAGWERLLSLIDNSIAMVEAADDNASAEMRVLRQRDENFRPFVVARISEFIT